MKREIKIKIEIKIYLFFLFFSEGRSRILGLYDFDA
jgi:hypothetical protein